MKITRLDDIIHVLKDKPRKRLVAMNAVDAHTIEAISQAVDEGIAEGILTGNPEKIAAVCNELNIDISKFTIEPAYSEEEAAQKTASAIVAGKADFMMKGLISTDKYMRTLLNKEYQLLPEKGMLSHVAVMQYPNHHKLLIVSDVAIIPYPDLSQKLVIIGYLAHVARALGIEKPKVALIAASEQVLKNVPSSVEAAVISKMAERGQIKGVIADGPLALDVAIDKKSADEKQLSSPVAGDADCLLFPNIDAGNVFYKVSAKLSNSEQAAIVMGARIPVVLSSRSDSARTKLYSIALAALLS